MADFDLSHLKADGLTLKPEETPEEEKHRLSEEAKDRDHQRSEAAKASAFKRRIGYGVAGVVIIAAGIVILSSKPEDRASFATNIVVTLVGAGVGYAIGKQAP